MRFRKAMSVLAQAMIEAEKLHPDVSSALCAVVVEFEGYTVPGSTQGYADALRLCRDNDGVIGHSSTYYWRKAVASLCHVAGVQMWHMKRLEEHIAELLNGTYRVYITAFIMPGEVGSHDRKATLAARVEWLRSLGRTAPAKPVQKCLKPR